jgi:hypothetical protein
MSDMPTDTRIRRCSLHVWLAAAALLVVLVASRSLQGAAPEGTDLFERKIRPLLVERCQKCHGSEKQWSSLRLDSRAFAITGGDSGPAVVAGKPDESEIIRRILEEDDASRMPPPEEGKRLSEEEVAAVKQWIKLGAPWPDSGLPDVDAKEKLRREHWAFQPVKKTEPPAVDPNTRVANEVDQFVIAKLQAAGLELAPEADRRTLIRRATYDLTGLPPTPEEVAEFENDARPDAYAKLVERLLASPRYGEQWGRHWLDVARYADTKGYVYDRENRFFINAWPYRDWVIRSLNEDLPYNRFLLLQIAADQAAPDDPESLAALGFLTLGRRCLGVTPDVIEDRIDTVSRGLLGLTVGCARCHDHKYDPIPTADYYSLYGVFQNCVERQVALPRNSADKAARQKVPRELEKLQKKLTDTIALRRKEAADLARSRINEYLAAQRKLEDYPDLGIIASAEKAELLPGVVRCWEHYLEDATKRSDPVFVPWAAYARLSTDEFSSRAAEISEQLAAERGQINPRVARAFETVPTSQDDVCERYAKVFAEVDTAWKKLCDDAKSAGQIEPKGLPDASDEALRQVLYGEGSPCEIPDEPIVNTEYFWSVKDVEEIWKLQAKVDKWIVDHPTEARYAVVLSDRAKIVEPIIFRRGNPMNRGDSVPRQFIEVASSTKRKPFEHGGGRLDLAEAIIYPANPLTARVWVNRVWLHHFGAGLVTTPSDFGARSTPPSHPELLDWLASEFVQHGWSTKFLHRTMMLSSTYRQSSAPRLGKSQLATVQTLDPENRLLWRMNPRRLSFEQFRDTLVASSGDMDFTMGGTAVELTSLRRSVYVQVDRQYLPAVFSVFDFASPDFHSAQRAETTTPQQALFALNNSFVADRAKKIAEHIQANTNDPTKEVHAAYRLILQREPSTSEAEAAEEFLRTAIANDESGKIAEEAKAWSYGYGEVDSKSGKVASFHELPHFTGDSWQGGPAWPDSALGWVRLTAKGGHPGNDHQHTAIRRWTAHATGVVSIKSEAVHRDKPGDGIRCWIVSERDGVLATATPHNSRKRLDVESLAVKAGDTIDFIVDIGKTLNSDDFVWVPTITQTQTGQANGTESDAVTRTWTSESGFPRVRLLPLEQFVQMLLVSNEAMFID